MVKFASSIQSGANDSGEKIMEIILLQRVEKLGQMGQLVNVKTGYARNYLLPQKKALRATKENIAAFEKQKAQLEAQNLKAKEDAQYVAQKLDGLTVDLIRQAGESGHLYGSVSGRDVSEVVTAAGVSISRQQVILDHPIKELGVHKARVVLHPELSVFVTLVVAQSEEEAAMTRDKMKSEPAA